MSAKMALIDFNKCSPDGCDNGLCLAVQACQRKLLAQEKVYEIPMPDPVLCRGCGDCVRACPSGAVKISVM